MLAHLTLLATDEYVHTHRQYDACRATLGTSYFRLQVNREIQEYRCYFTHLFLVYVAFGNFELCNFSSPFEN